jgi:hypothetical protein
VKNFLKYLMGILTKSFGATNAGKSQESTTKEPMINKMSLQRRVFSNRSTIGILTLNDYSCWVLEPPARRIGDNPVCIPAGQYKLRIRPNSETRFDYDVIELLNVHGRTDILIHIGNSPDDTKGCLLLGKDHKADWVSDSREAFNELFPLVKAEIEKGDFYIGVVG